MAHQRKGINQKAHGGRVKGFGVSAPGDAPNTGMPVSLPPTRKLAPDVISAPRKAVNAPLRSPPSAIPPGTQLLSPMAEVLRQDGDDGTLERIVREGTSVQDTNDELRVVDATPLKAAHGLRSRTANQEGGKVPNKIG